MAKQVKKKKPAILKKINLREKMSDHDILKLCREDHKPLKKLIEVLKDPDEKFDVRQDAFVEFEILLNLHSVSEEVTLYMALKSHEEELRIEGYEGDIEHGLAKGMLEKTKESEEDEEFWTASAKVLAELVEHHIEEEEKNVFPRFKKRSTSEERIHLGDEYLLLKSNLEDSAGNSSHKNEKPIHSSAM